MTIYAKHIIRHAITGAAAIALLLSSATGCMSWDYGDETEQFSLPDRGLFICNEGNFQYGNATLSFYNPENGMVENELFFRANGMRLGDVAQSMTIRDNKGWIAVNNSHVVFAINTDSGCETGRIVNLPSPRYIHFVSDSKAYITQLWDNRIFIVDPQRYEITGTIRVPGMDMESGSTERMVQVGKYVYCNCWSYQNSIIRIDTATDSVDRRLEIGIQPRSLATDCNGKLWVLTDGGYEGSPYGHEDPALFRINLESFTVERKFRMRPGETAGALAASPDGSQIFWINSGVWRMDVTSDRLPDTPIIESRATKFYDLTIDPESGDIYVADAIDYQQQGQILRFSPEGSLKDEFYAGITPGAFCWKDSSGAKPESK